MKRVHRRTSAAIIVGLVVAAGTTGAVSASAAEYGEWQDPAPVTAVNDPVAADGCPAESPDGLRLFIASTRDGGDQDIWMATRSSLDEAFGAPTMLAAPVNTAAQDFCPTPLPGHRLLFVSTRGGVDAYGTTGCGLGDIYLTRYKKHTGTWTAPRNLGCAPDGPNGPGMEYGPSLIQTGTGSELYFSSGAPLGGGTQDIYRSVRAGDGSFGAPQPVTELNTPVDDVMPNLSKDGLEIVFASTRTGGAGSFDIYTSSRSHDTAAWETPENVTAVNTAASETRPFMSWDRSRLYVGRAGEILVSHRGRG